MKLSLLLVVYTCVIACANARGVRQVEIISATAELRCSDGSLVNCLVDPCDVTSCELPYAGCEADYCGGCNAIYYDADGNVLDCSDHLGECPTIVDDDQICIPCISDRNCGTSEKCCDDCCKVAVTKPYGCLMSDGSVWPDGAYRIIDCVLCQCQGTAFRCIVQICDVHPCPGGVHLTSHGYPVFCGTTPQTGSIIIEDCPSGYSCLGDPNYKYSLCCPDDTTLGCYVNNAYIPNGDYYINDECYACQCVNGRITCEDTPLCDKMCPSGVQPYKDDQNINALCSVAIGVDSILTQTCPRGFYCNMITSTYGVCCPLKLDDVCYYNGVAYPVGGTVIWGCALCQCRDGGFVCLYPPGLICDPSEPICPNGDDYYTSTGTDVNFCTLPLDAPLGLTQGDCPADYFCHPLDLGYSICCPAISGDCVVNGVLIPNGGVILMPDCVLCKCIDGAMACIEKLPCDEICPNGGDPYVEDGVGTVFCSGALLTSEYYATRIKHCPRGYECTALDSSGLSVCCPIRDPIGCPCPRIPIDSFPVCLSNCDNCMNHPPYDICCIDEKACPGGCVGFINTVGYCRYDCEYFMPGDTITVPPCTECQCTNAKWDPCTTDPSCTCVTPQTDELGNVVTCSSDVDCLNVYGFTCIKGICCNSDWVPCEKPLLAETGYPYNCAFTECPTGYSCVLNFEYGVCCPDKYPCCLEPESGPCEAYFPRWYHDCRDNKCKEFIYGGCQGNDNNFHTRADCEKECGGDCCLPVDPGPCKGSISRWYFDCETNECIEFVYGGCEGNNNNFETEEACRRHCDGPCPCPEGFLGQVCWLNCDVCDEHASTTPNYICCNDGSCPAPACLGGVYTPEGFCELDCEYYSPGDVVNEDCEICVCREGDWICRPDPACGGPCPCPVDFVPEVCWESCDECIANSDQDYLCCSDIENCPPPSCLGGHYIEGYCEKNCTYYKPFETYVENCEICECRNGKWYCKPDPDCVQPPCPMGIPLIGADGSPVSCDSFDKQCPFGYHCYTHPTDLTSVCCPNTECVDGAWTVWFDRDDPGTTGDWETTSLAIKLYGDNMCTDPSAIQVQTLDGIPAEDTGEIFLHYSPDIGFVCRMADQPDNTCFDYQVRYCCPVVSPCSAGFPLIGEDGSEVYCGRGGVECPFGYHCVIHPADAFAVCCPNTECEDGEWTIWFDRDNPGTTGDWETTQDLIKQFGDLMCSNPSAIQVQTLDGIPAADTGEIFSHYSPEVGFVCQMADQPDNTCLDYEVRFCCPANPPCDGEWSQWFDEDSPEEGIGDLETLATLCEKTCKRPSAIQAQTIDGIPAELTGDVLLSNDIINGFACLNEEQDDEKCEDYKVRFCCPEQPDCDKWTKWFNTDEPCEGSDADREITAVIQDEYPSEMCINPLFIQVVVAATEQPSSSTGQVFLHHDVDPGFVCLDKDQPAGDQCHDYKVRYCCDEQPDKPGQCPMVPSIDAVRPKGYCYYECQDDTDCQGKKKCCASGICGTICMDPVFPCFHEGVIYQEGDERKEDCNTCYCTSDGTWVCTKILCGDTVIEAVELEATAERLTIG